MKKYAKTEAGHIAFKTRSGAIPARLRSVFILFDGHKTLAEVLQMGTVLGATPADIDDLVAAGLLELVGGNEPPAPAATAAKADTKAPPVRAHAVEEAPTPEEPDSMSHSELYARAMPIATKITAGLGLRGFRLNLAVESAMGYQDLCALFPKIKAAAGDDKVRALEKALRLG